MEPQICVVIAAYKAETTIGAAVRSALAEPIVAEVMVVDDASPDGTCDAALAAEDGSGRLRLIRSAMNQGPAAARNAGIDASRSPLLAILDADDRFLPDRFTSLMANDDWDFVADNIVFVREGESIDGVPDGAHSTDLKGNGIGRIRTLSFTEFVERNISVRGRPRAELGFLKPVMRRSCLLRLGLRYDEGAPLGEDFVLYATALARGARFKLAEHCGYLAIERAGSLSSSYKTASLVAALAADDTLAAIPTLTADERRLVERHRNGIKAKVAHRLFLDRKREGGALHALLPLLADPLTLAGVGRDIARDKRAARTRARPAPTVRYLFDPAEFDAHS